MGKQSPSSLQQLQQDFAQALHYQPNQAVSHVSDGRFPAEQLIQIYRNNFIISLSEVLEATYPCVQAVVGEECFSQLARQHVLTVPLGQGDVSDYGDGFAITIESEPELLQAVPYLADLARLEWAVDSVSQLPPATPSFPLEKLARITEENLPTLRLVVAKSTLCLNSAYPVASLWQMITSNNIEEIDLTQPESAIIQHRAEQVHVISTTTNAISLIHLSQQHQCLANATAPMLALLGELIQQHVFADIYGLPEGE
ncbi:putative DNA-binding domain-containing protein [Photobacterium minamisatsumaniensis]|uniref:HvfC/BufC family peptide modification chaperone n=1 Tax=Photobacterium minamisatsumaniensis TaxID=2910233 RepID=UPI003D103F10